MLNGGSGMAGPIWVNTMRQALNGVQNTPFTQPSSVIQKPVCYGSGGLASTSGTNTYNEYFLASALPTTTCNTETKKEEPEKQPEEEQKTDQTEEKPTSGTGDTDPNTENNGNGNGNGNGSGNGGTGNGSGSGGGVTLPPSNGGTLLP
jgi:membrane peptidoglycan carboxypeptidase